MNTFQLAQVLTKDPFTKERFACVYACNQLSSIKINEFPKSFVVNTDPMELPGTYRTNERRILWLLRKHPIHYNKYFLDFINRNGVQWEHNKIQLQSAFSSVCEQYCIYFLYRHCGKRLITSIVNSFVNDKLHNDQ